jgi:hypothetical protein
MGAQPVLVRAPTARRDFTQFLTWTLLALTLCAVVVLVRVLPARSRISAVERLPYQQHFSALPQVDQQRFVELREGILEIENRRGRSGQWPEVEALRSEEAPPIVSGVTGAEQLRWKKRQQGTYVNYLGTPVSGNGSAQWLILFIEPAPGLLKAPGEPPPPLDEEHHTLSDGTALHVTVWTMSAKNESPAVVVPFPAADGWTQLLGR